MKRQNKHSLHKNLNLKEKMLSSSRKLFTITAIFFAERAISQIDTTKPTDAVEIQQINAFMSTAFAAQGDTVNEEIFNKNARQMQNGYSVNIDLERTTIRYNSFATGLVESGDKYQDLGNLTTERQNNYPGLDPRDLMAGYFTGNNYGGAAQPGPDANGYKYFVVDTDNPREAGHEGAHCFSAVNGAHNNGPITNIEVTGTNINTGVSGTLTDGFSLGNQSNTTGTATQVFSVSNAKNVGNPANGGNGYAIHQGEYFGEEYLISIPYTELQNPSGENTSDKIVDYHNSADPGAGHRFENVTPLATPTVSVNGDQITVSNPASFDNLWISNTTNPAYSNIYKTQRTPKAYLYLKANQSNNQYVWSGDLSETVDLSVEGLDPSLIYVMKVGTKRGNAISPASSFITLSLENYEIENLQIYPNPTNNQLSIKATAKIEHIVLLDILGKQILNRNPSKMEINLNLSNLTSGIYLMKLKSKNGTSIKKIIKN